MIARSARAGGQAVPPRLEAARRAAGRLSAVLLATRCPDTRFYCGVEDCVGCR